MPRAILRLPLPLSLTKFRLPIPDQVPSSSAGYPVIKSKLNEKTSTSQRPFFTGEQQREDKPGYIYLLMGTDVECWRSFQQEIALLLIRTRDSEPCGAHLRIKCLGAQPACLHQTSIGYRRLGKGRNLARMAAEFWCRTISKPSQCYQSNSSHY